MLESDDLDEAMIDARQHSHSKGRQETAEADQRRRVQEGDHGRNKDVGGNVGQEEQAASLPNGEHSGKESESDADKGSPAETGQIFCTNITALHGA